MVELGMTPASRSRVAAENQPSPRIEFHTIYEAKPAAEMFIEKINAISKRMAAAREGSADADGS
jgi:hypothetical protein